jgi:uncharacterized protein YdcH (DUF465 family)
MKPYTYLIKHRPTGQVYYGVRSANIVDPHEDLWSKYYTSSPKVQRLIEETGKESFDVEVRRVFETKEQAVAWETKVLRRCKVLHDDRWINQNVAGYIIPTEESNKKISDFHKGKPKSDIHKKNMSVAQKGKPKKSTTYQSQEYRDLMSKIKSGKGNGRYGKEVSNETRQKISDAKKGKQVAHNKGIPMSDNQKLKLREKMLGRKVDPEAIARRVAKQTGQKREKLFCPHCERDIAVGWYNRHGDKCRHRG